MGSSLRQDDQGEDVDDDDEEEGDVVDDDVDEGGDEDGDKDGDGDGDEDGGEDAGEDGDDDGDAELLTMARGLIMLLLAVVVMKGRERGISPLARRVDRSLSSSRRTRAFRG